ncbi:MAG: hypothetical protein KBC27_02715 [Rickettsiales bacterium]|nr:hypothetical protein [Rickettsiales bacterium]
MSIKDTTQHQYIIQVQKILEQIHDPEILQKKKFCDEITKHYKNGFDLPIEEAQKTTGLTYDDDGFCPPYK